MVGALVAIICCLFVGRALARQWSLARDAVAAADLLWLGLGLIAALAGMTVLAATWAATLRLLGADIGWFPSVAAYFRGELGKYVPGGPWGVVGRSELIRRRGFGRGVGYGSVIVSLLAGYVACALVAVVLVPFSLDLSRPRAALWVIPAAFAGLALLHPAPWRRVLALIGRGADVGIPPLWRQTLGLVLRSTPAWLLVGGATWCAAKALHADIGFARVMFAASVAWLGGFAAVPVPSGVGIREAIFVALAGPLPAGIAAAVAVTARLTFVLCDVVAAAACTLVSWFLRRRQAGEGPGVGERL